MIQLSETNPYRKGIIYQYTQTEVSLERKNTQYIPTPTDLIHTVSEDETLWSISFKRLGTSKWWWLIYELNLDLIPDPFNELISGIDLLIPDITSFKLQNP